MTSIEAESTKEPQDESNRTKAAASTTSSTRVCIKNVPLSFTEKKLSHFLIQGFPKHESAPLEITDCFILKKGKKSRGVAFVGLKTADMAAAVVKHFHLAYAQTSKLLVSPAWNRKDAPQHQESHDKKASKDSSIPTGNNKNKHANAVEEPDNIGSKEKTKVDTKKEEFFAAMGVSSSSKKQSKFWANDDAVTEEGPTEEVLQETAQLSKQEEDSASVSSSSSSSSEDGSSVDSGGKGADAIDGAKTIQPPAGSVRVSDMDFLRSKVVAENLSDDDDEESDDEAASKEESHLVKGQKDDNDSVSSSSVGSTSSSDSSSSSSSDEEDQGNDMQAPEKNATESSPPTTIQEQEEHANESTKKTPNPDQNSDMEVDDDSKNIDPFRLFVRNLTYITTEEDLRAHFESIGEVTECHVPIDDTKKSKGFGFVKFKSSDDAAHARATFDGTDFQGRLLHILPARRGHEEDDIDMENLTYKQKQELLRKNSTKGWMTSFVRGDAVVDNLSERLGLRKGDILNVKDGLSSGDAAVRLALGETQIIQENREYFQKHGIDMDALVSMPGGKPAKGEIKRSNTSILVKNLPFDTTVEELAKVFHGIGGDVPKQILLPPSRTIAMVEYGHANDARRAFKKLTYRRFKHVPLYLEWAPVNSKTSGPVAQDKSPRALEQVKEVKGDHEEEEADVDATSGTSHTLYVKNLNFKTTEAGLRRAFEKHVKPIRSVRIPTKAAPLKGPGGSEGELRFLSMGFGFVECDSTENAKEALKALQGSLLDGHALEIKLSSKQEKPKKAATSKTSTKLIIRNVPFEATRRELLQLFGSVGQLKKVRLPKKFDGSHRGFAFVEYLTGQDAQKAMTTLGRTHLYGRHLVLEWAQDHEDLETLREKSKRNMTGEPVRQNKKIRFDT